MAESMDSGLRAKPLDGQAHEAAFRTWALADGAPDATWGILWCEAAAIVGPQFTRDELGTLIDALAATVDREHRENAPLLRRLQMMYKAASRG